MIEEIGISLPRPLVNQLLHAAQLQPSQNHWGIITSRSGTPEYCRALNTDRQSAFQAISALREYLVENQEQIWALYCSGSAEIGVPDPAELARCGTPRFLAISLGTKGVLQLRGWQANGPRLQEQEVSIRET